MEKLPICWFQSKDRKIRFLHYYGEITNLLVSIEGQENPVSVVETNDFGADDIPVGSSITLTHDRDAFVVMEG